MQLGRATFEQPNLSFSTKSNYPFHSIVMEGKHGNFYLNKLALNMQARPWYLISILGLIDDK